MENKALRHELKRIKLFMEGGLANGESQEGSNIDKLISKDLYNMEELLQKKSAMVFVYLPLGQ
jgi:hypothetical protein